jgi:lipoyl(octanoyl) transferase
MDIRWLGRIAFEEALALQEDIRVRIHSGEAPETFLLLEHDPVYTIGRTQDRSSLREQAHLPHPVVEINRGGQATYHGPGQLVGYALFDLRLRGKDLHKHLRSLEELLITFLSHYKVRAIRRQGLTGAWVEERKIASIGVGVRQWVTMHGFALNIAADLSGFTSITPCGIPGVEMTSLSRETGMDHTVEEAAHRLEEILRTKQCHFIEPD